MKLTKTQIKCIEKSILFEKPNKNHLQMRIDNYKCLKGYTITYARKSQVIMLKPMVDGNCHKVDIKISYEGINK